MDKETTRVTVDDLARMIQESVVHKPDIDRLESNLVAVLARLEQKVDALPERVADRIVDYANLKARVEALEQRTGFRP
jgi:hypothetical protein